MEHVRTEMVAQLPRLPPAIADALLTCDDGNRASAAVIERAGGVLQDVADVDGHRTRRYLLPTGAGR